MRSARPDPSAVTFVAALEALDDAVAEHAAARSRLESAELERARAVAEARRAGLTTRTIGRILGVSHVRVVQLCGEWADRVSTDETRAQLS